MSNNIYDKIKEFIKKNGLFILAIAAILFITFFKLPYEVEMPGGIIDLQNRVKINGETNEIDGSFNMAYVSVVDGSIPYVLIGLINPDWEVVKESDVKFENETIEDANNRNKLYLEQSKNFAIIAAMKEANIEFKLEDKENRIIYVGPKAETDIKVGDNIISINDTSVSDTTAIKKIINEKEVGESIKLKIIRDNKEKEVEAKVYEENDEKFIGISIVTLMNIISDTKVEISTKASESGPSGGMMMSLMIYNALTKQDLTKGRKIVGTGTINPDGEVGVIGGIKQKVMGAARNKADVILVPEENYEEAHKVKEEKKYKLEVVSVKTLKDAIEYLEKN